MNRSWRTTTAGLAAALGVILAWVLPLLGVEITDGKAEEVAGAILLLAGVAYGFFSARDDRVTSEGRDAREYRPKAGALIALALIPACLVAVGGCTSAGAQARDSVLSPWAVGAWPKVEALAQRGIADMIDDGELSEASAESPRETVRLFGEAVGELGGGS